MYHVVNRLGRLARIGRCCNTIANIIGRGGGGGMRVCVDPCDVARAGG